VVNASYLCCALITAASVLRTIARHRDTGPRGTANARICVDEYPSLMSEVTASARRLLIS
jgi:hypothetical protein